MFVGSKAQLLKSQTHITPTQQFTSCYVRNINSFTVDKLKSKLNTEIWQDMFERFDTNVAFSSFITCIKIVYKYLTKSKPNSTHRYNLCITGGIKVTCRKKSNSYLSGRGKSDMKLKLRYQKIFHDINRFYKNNKIVL